MKLPLSLTLIVLVAAFQATVYAQRPKLVPKSSAQRAAEVGQTAVVMDETLSVLRDRPSLFANSIQRMRRGRRVQIIGTTEADGVKFFRVAAPPSSFGWVQADAVFGKFRLNDDERLARLVVATGGFDQIEAASEYFALYPDSKLRPSILLLFGDLLEDAATKLSKDATSRLKRSEMVASGAPLHSYYLNFVGLDRYRKLGVTFVFNSAARAFHYDGASWSEIVKKYPKTPEAVEAQKRLDTLKIKMEAAK